jgi:hypothetical protein
MSELDRQHRIGTCLRSPHAHAPFRLRLCPEKAEQRAEGKRADYRDYPCDCDDGRLGGSGGCSATVARQRWLGNRGECGGGAGMT